MTDDLDTLNLQSRELRAGLADLERLAEGFGRSMVTAFAGAIVHGRSFSDVLRGLMQSLLGASLAMGLRPLGGLLGGLFGNIVGGSRIAAFGSGGLARSPTLFPRDGSTGAASPMPPPAPRGGAAVTVNIATPDLASFRRSETQVAALVARAVARGQRNL